MRKVLSLDSFLPPSVYVGSIPTSSYVSDKEIMAGAKKGRLLDGLCTLGCENESRDDISFILYAPPNHYGEDKCYYFCVQVKMNRNKTLSNVIWLTSYVNTHKPKKQLEAIFACENRCLPSVSHENSILWSGLPQNLFGKKH